MIRYQSLLLASVFAVLLFGCATAQYGHNGGLQIVRLTYPVSASYVDLRADYGYIIAWPETGDPSFYVFDKSHRSRIKLSNWNDFIQELKRLPDGITIDEVTRCTAGFSPGMPAARRDELRAALAEKLMRPIAWDDDRAHTTFCYCETRRVEVLFDRAR